MCKTYLKCIALRGETPVRQKKMRTGKLYWYMFQWQEPSATQAILISVCKMGASEELPSALHYLLGVSKELPNCSFVQWV